MRYILILLLSMLFVGSLALVSSCKKTPSNNCTAVRVSIPGVGLSHNNGQPCQRCHIYQSFGPGCFSISGSVYQANKIDYFTKGEIRIYTEPNGQGQLKGTFYVDSRGNFYSTATIAWSEEYYVAFDDGNGNTKHMQNKVNSGDCNSCHGTFANRIFAP